MTYNFDQPVQRSGSDSIKWAHYGNDVLPMWVADMDFISPEPIRQAIHDRVDHGVFGYSAEPLALREAIAERLQRQHQWRVQPEEIVFLPGLVCGLNVVSRAIGQAGDSVLVNTPVYPPFLSAPTNQDRTLLTAAQALVRDGQKLHYKLDIDALEAAVQPDTRLFILCNPHNPTGLAFSKDELMQIADLCQRHDLVICSDEIHCELLLGDTQHVPIASLDPAISARTITLLAPSKTYNIPALGCSLAIVQDAELRGQLKKAASGIVPHVNVLGYAAALAAYQECDEWLLALRSYLTANRDFVVEYVKQHLPNIGVTVPDATYLAWLDCRESSIEGDPYQFFLNKAKVALNDGARFGAEGEGFVRLNFGCARSTVQDALDRMRDAL